jgi:dipeptidyl aminopeptidase/acylaminoacyl peptidase
MDSKSPAAADERAVGSLVERKARIVNRMVIVWLAVVMAVYLLPLFFRKKPSRLKGPDLSELTYTEVFFNNGGLSLSGLLFLPDGNGPIPVGVVIHGSGTSQRNSPWYLTVTKYLQENGIAVLLPDKRGSEKSGGDWTKATFRDLAGDAISAIDFVRDQMVFDYSSIGIIGFSQGGWITPIVATESKEVASVVNMSGAGVTTDEQLLHEEENHIADLGIWRPVAKLIAFLTARAVKRREFWRMIAGFDPIPYWQKVDLPVLLAFGENDKNVPVKESVRRIEALNRTKITIKVYPEGGHGIIDHVSHRVQEACLRDVVDFIRQVEPRGRKADSIYEGRTQ